MRLRVALAALVCSGVLNQTTWAHPGHAVETANPTGLTHYLTHPDHVGQWLVALIAISVGILILRRIKRLVPAYARARKRQ